MYLSVSWSFYHLFSNFSFELLAFV
jgi:hypothetical protein